eukprot:3137160-Amphidinium_carterae.2
MGQVKVIQQLMVTKTNVSPHTRAGCVVASINHLGIYGLMNPVENLGSAAASTHDVNWVDAIKTQDVIGMRNTRDLMNQLYATRGRSLDFPRVANPTFNPDAESTSTTTASLLPQTLNRCWIRLLAFHLLSSLDSPCSHRGTS